MSSPAGTTFKVFKYVTHARTLEELRAEFISSINREIDTLTRSIGSANGAAEKSRIIRGQRELEHLRDFWTDVEITGRTDPTERTDS